MPFPSPADDHSEKRLDVNELLVPHPDSIYFMRTTGEAMVGAGFQDRDIVVIDRALTASDQSIVDARLGTELMLRRLRMKDGRTWLVAANLAYQSIDAT